MKVGFDKIDSESNVLLFKLDTRHEENDGRKVDGRHRVNGRPQRQMVGARQMVGIGSIIKDARQMVEDVGHWKDGGR